MSSIDGARGLLGAEDETFDKACDLCNFEGSKKETVKFCSDCTEWICFKCTDSYQTFKFSRYYKIFSVAQAPRQAVGEGKSCLVLCEDCLIVEVSDYCEQHNTVTCQAWTSEEYKNFTLNQ